MILRGAELNLFPAPRFFQILKNSKKWHVKSLLKSPAGQRE